MFEKSEDTAGTTIELLRTTINAVGLDSSLTYTSTASTFFILGVIPFFILLAAMGGVAVNMAAESKQEAHRYGKLAAICAVVSALIYCPLVVDSDTYSENPLRRMSSAPALVDEENSGSDNNTVVSVVHDQVQDELDTRREGLTDLGVDKACHTQKLLAGHSRDTLSVLCGGYSLDPVDTDKATITPVVETSADEPWWPWSIDPYAVEVTVSIQIDKK